MSEKNRKPSLLSSSPAVLMMILSFLVFISQPNILTMMTAEACKCVAPPHLPTSYYAYSDVMVVEILCRRLYQDLYIHVGQVESTYKGCTQPSDFVILKAQSSSAACGIELPVDARMVITAQVEGSNVFWVSSCGYNLVLYDADADDANKNNGINKDSREVVDEINNNDEELGVSLTDWEFLNSRYWCCAMNSQCYCGDGTEPVNCFQDPCNDPSQFCGEGQCTSNYCGGCNTDWFNPTTQQPVCNTCRDDSDCGRNQVCIVKEGCRSACTTNDDCSRGLICGEDGVCIVDDVNNSEPPPAKNDKLYYYETCGDPACHGHDDKPDIPKCTENVKIGKQCTKDQEGTLCDDGNECNALIVCSKDDPRLQGCPISRRSRKRNISYLDDTTLDGIASDLLSFRLATWNYNHEPQDIPSHLGFIIDDVEPSPSVRDGDGDMVDLYGYLSMTVATLQSQQKQIETLREQIEELRQQNQCEKNME